MAMMKGFVVQRPLVACLLLLLGQLPTRATSYETARSGRHRTTRGSNPSTFFSLLRSHDSDTASSSHIRSFLGPFAFRSFPSSCRSWLVQQAALRNVTASEGEVATYSFPSIASRALTRLRSEDISTTTTTDRSPSVHLRLREETTTTPTAAAAESEEEVVSPPPPAATKNQTKSNLTIHTYTDSRGRLWKALNTPKAKFLSFLQYHKLSRVTPDEVDTEETTTHVEASVTSARRKEWRDLWQEGRLLTERTEYLAVYPSDGGAAGATTSSDRPSKKRGGFGDLLHLYTQRLLSILKDEQEDKRSMMRWLQRSYGREATNRLKASELDKYPASEQMSHLKDFLQWFRGEFPYYYDRCSQCGASIRDDVANNIEQQPSDADCDEKGHKTFLGYVYPAKTELKGKASRTELYKCHECSHYTRFPRYNAAWHVMEHQRGRCGEYSMVLFRMLRALAYETRWVVDWADHVWVEVWLPRASQWVHLDPCEAAVNENLIYQSWGKKATYVVGFYAPRELPPVNGGSSRTSTATNGERSLEQTPLIEDITRTYTTDSIRTIRKRRDESAAEVESSIRQSAADLRMRLETGLYQNDN